MNEVILPAVEKSLEQSLVALRRPVTDTEKLYALQQVNWRLCRHLGEPAYHATSAAAQEEARAKELAADAGYQRRLAALRTALSGTMDFRRILSSMALDMRYPHFQWHVLSRESGLVVSRYHYAEARRNAAELGAGRAPEAIPIVRSSLRDRQCDLDFATAVVMTHCRIEANGVRRHFYSHGEESILPKVTIACPETQLIAEYRLALQENEEQARIGVLPVADAVQELPAAHFRELTKALTGDKSRRDDHVFDALCAMQRPKLVRAYKRLRDRHAPVHALDQAVAALIHGAEDEIDPDAPLKPSSVDRIRGLLRQLFSALGDVPEDLALVLPVQHG